MDVQHDIGQGQQSPIEVIGNFLGHGAVRLTGETAIEIALVDRRRAPTSMERRGVHERDDNHPPRYLGGRQALRQLAQRHRAFVFVTVVTAGKQRSRTLAALNHRYRNHHRAPGRIVPGIRQFEESVLHAFAGKVHRGIDRIVR